ncbi:MAG: phosphate ABC transporter ATP-binding protein [Chloroflexi bacterium]|nr:phosphate ABC transporter ATP-binding protein [Chloroflexota bacterium]
MDVTVAAMAQVKAAEATDAVTRVSKGLVVENLEAYYGTFKAITDVNMTIHPNKVTAFIGPSGCGKSTFIRCINRLHEVIRDARVTGRIMLDEQNLYDASIDPVIVRRHIGMVFQRPNPFPTMSIYDNVAAGLRLNGVRNHGLIADKVEHSLQAAALWDEVKDKLKKPALALSGGQQQRLCIARTMAVDPAVVLMDEPCSALDPISTLKIEDLISELKQTVTIVIVTHNMQQAARVSDYTAFFLANEQRSGELVEFGATRTIFTNPGDQRTESYITGRFG